MLCSKGKCWVGVPGLGAHRTNSVPCRLHRWPAVRAMLMPAIIARQMRIFPAFSVGGVVNKALRGMFARMLGA